MLAEIERQAGEIRAAEESDKKWAAFSQVTRLLTASVVTKSLKTLMSCRRSSRTSQVKTSPPRRETNDARGEQPHGTHPRPSQEKPVQLEKIIADFPETDLAERAQKLLATQQATPK